MTTWSRGKAPVFLARYPGRCWTCEEPIRVDQPVTYDQEQLVHANCDPAAPDTKPEAPACPRCHMIPSANGTCECD